MQRTIISALVLIVINFMVAACGLTRRVPIQDKHEVLSERDSSLVRLIREELRSADLVITQAVVEYYEPPHIRDPTPPDSLSLPKVESGPVKRTVNTQIRLQASQIKSIDSTAVDHSQKEGEVQEHVEPAPEPPPSKSKAVLILKYIFFILLLLVLVYIIIRLRIANILR